MKAFASTEAVALESRVATAVLVPSSVQFTADRGIVLPLEVNARDGEITLSDLSALLFELRVQIIERAEVREDRNVVFRLLVVEFDGGQLSRRRRHGCWSFPWKTRLASPNRSTCRSN